MNKNEILKKYERLIKKIKTYKDYDLAFRFITYDYLHNFLEYDNYNYLMGFLLGFVSNKKLK